MERAVFTNTYEKKPETPVDPKDPKTLCIEKGSDYKWNEEKKICETVYRKPATGIE